MEEWAGVIFLFILAVFSIVFVIYYKPNYEHEASSELDKTLERIRANRRRIRRKALQDLIEGIDGGDDPEILSNAFLDKMKL